MITGIFARADHPRGYGYGEKAHGYSVLFVLCADETDLRETAELLSALGIREPMQQSHPWYGGRFDLLAVTEGSVDLCPYELRRRGANGERLVSMGDNRFIGRFTSAEIRDLKSAVADRW